MPLLGGRVGEAFGGGGGSTSTFVDLELRQGFGSGFSATASARRGWTSFGGGSFQSGAYAVDFAKTGLFGSSDRLGLRIAQPLFDIVITVPGTGAQVSPDGDFVLTRVDFTELVPEPVAFLGQAAYIQLDFFESLSRAVATAPTLVAKEGLSAAAGVALRKHHDLIAELRRLDVEPEAVMAPVAMVRL